jgi:hypothetical protein
MTTQKIANAFYLPVLPPFAAPERDTPDGDVTNYGPAALWSGIGDPPTLGSRVLVTMNGLGSGTVKAYFVESGWLGVHVDLDSPPEWWVKQNVRYHGRQRWATVFGAEVGASGL